MLRLSGKIDEEVFEELEAILIQADVGVKTTLQILEETRDRVKEEKIREPELLYDLIKDSIKDVLCREEHPALASGDSPTVILMVGVNGTGKTTTTGKLACLLGQGGKKVLVAAADTFRAAAVDQLGIWAERAGAGIIKHQDGSDPAAVVYDAAEAAVARGIDYLLVDTAGRLHTKVNLMEELKKIARVANKIVPGAPHETLLVLDATMGQNAISQARAFTEALGVTGIVLAKLDGTAKGGIVVAIQDELNLPVRYVGVGEALEDLRPFSPDEFVEALFAQPSGD